jgi:AraC-like DNA-binding protein
MLLSNESLTQIALACGFADQAHYCRVFRDVVGLTPNAWRRRNMNLAPDELMTTQCNKAMPWTKSPSGHRIGPTFPG